MSIIETIKAEVERLKGICLSQTKANPGETFPFIMEMTGYDKLLSFLDTLEEPKVKVYEATCVDFDDDGTPVFYGDSKVPDLELDDKITFRVWWKKK